MAPLEPQCASRPSAHAAATPATTAVHRGRRTMVWQTRVTTETERLVVFVTKTQLVIAAGGALFHPRLICPSWCRQGFRAIATQGIRSSKGISSASIADRRSYGGGWWRLLHNAGLRESIIHERRAIMKVSTMIRPDPGIEPHELLLSRHRADTAVGAGCGSIAKPAAPTPCSPTLPSILRTGRDPRALRTSPPHWCARPMAVQADGATGFR
jgi:hypothetical protein